MGHQRDTLAGWAKGQTADLDMKSQPPGGRVPEFKPFGNFGEPAVLPSTTERAHDSLPAHPRETTAEASDFGESLPVSHSGMQVHNRYLITENESGILVIDQHALHERILYEQLREKVLAGTLEKQRLLVPEPVNLTPAEAGAALGAKDTLAQLGIEIEPFGGDTVLVSTYPAMLANFDPSEVLRQLAEQILSSEKKPERQDMLDEMLHMISCKAAIKAGDRLAPEEISALLEQRDLYKDTHHCPHGRPTALVFTREELDKRFKRT
jgi:DNA mismatch repair protein MutL